MSDKRGGSGNSEEYLDIMTEDTTFLKIKTALQRQCCCERSRTEMKCVGVVLRDTYDAPG